MPDIPGFDPLDRSMSGDDADPVLRAQVLEVLERDFERQAETSVDPAQVRAIKEFLADLRPLWEHRRDIAAGLSSPRPDRRALRDACDARQTDGSEDPEAVFAETKSVLDEVRARYDKAKFGADPVGRAALADAVSAAHRTWVHWAKIALGQAPATGDSGT
jgi:hypothetical protein